MSISVAPLDKITAIDFINNYHYSKILPRLTKLYLGVYEVNDLIGVITLGWGTQPLHTIRKVLPGHDLTTANYFEIGKMCFLPSKNKSNYGSRIMSKLLKYVRANTDVDFIYTLADGIMGKCGYIYQASNFKYMGKFKTYVYVDDVTKEKIHPRSCKQLHLDNAVFEGRPKIFWLTHDFCVARGISKVSGYMFRYIYPITTKGKAILKAYTIETEVLANPKEENLIYTMRVGRGKSEVVPKLEFNMDVFNHNYQKPTAIGD